MRYLLIFLIFFFTNTTQALQHPNLDKLEQIFKAYLPNTTVYTKVPRGLVISIDEKIFFNTEDVKIKENALYILDSIANIIKDLQNKFVIETHTTEKSLTFQDWELSMIRSSNLAKYFTKYHKIPSDKITALGFGNSVPYRYDKTNIHFNTNNRIDFVIIEYEAKR